MNHTIAISESSLLVTLTAALQLENLDVPAAEVHGVVTGLICVEGRATSAENVLSLVLERGEHVPGENLVTIVAQTQALVERAMHDGDYEFELLLVDEALDLESRTQAVAAWCQGFMLGLLHDGRIAIEDLPGDAGEAASDILAISEAVSGVEDDETEERALMELEEYCRVGAQLIFEELHPNMQGSSDAEPGTRSAPIDTRLH